MARKNSDISREVRLSNQIKQIVAQFLKYESKDPLLEFLTITDVKMTGDLQNATVYWTHLDDSLIYEVDKSLKAMTGRVRTSLAKVLTSRLTPKIRFVEDTLDRNVASVEDLLAQAKHRDLETEKQAKTAHFAGDEDPYKLESKNDNDLEE